MYYVYVLKIENDFYIGYTKDLVQRIKQHKREGNVQLVYYEAYQFDKLARTREKKLKYHGSAWRGLRNRIIA